MPISTQENQNSEIDIRGIYRYGSNTSDDIDLFIAIDRIPTDDDDEYLITLKEMVQYIVREHIGVSKKPVDYSFIHIREGVIDWCEYDDLEECNNALFYTFNHHEYNNIMVGTNPIKQKLTQNVSFKIVKVVRQLLTYLSRTECRKDVKYLLRNGKFKERLEYVLQLVSEGKISKLETFNKNLSDIEILKDIAFSFIQLYSLVHDIDVFCKKDACFRYPDLAPFILKKDDAEWDVLEGFIIETFNALSMNIEVFDAIDAVKFIRDEKACLNKEERVIDDHTTKRLQ